MNKYGEFQDKCGSCGYMDLNDYRGCKYYCKRDYTYYDIMNDKCLYYTEACELDDNRDYYDIKKANRSDCYLTTIVCTILGFADDCEILNVMRMLRNNILQKNKRYMGLLMEYDFCGPRIAKCLLEDENAKWIAKELLENFLKPIILYIGNNDYEAAIVMYENMTNILKENYNINDYTYYLSDYDQTKGGHGVVYRKVNN